MRNLQIILIVLFLVVSVAFAAVYVYDRAAIDRVAPQIVSDGVPLEVSVNATDRELCAGLTATDDRDGDITDRIIVHSISRLIGADTANVSYAVFDSASNYCTFTREVRYTDYRKPRFGITEPLIYRVSSTISLTDSLTASDVIDGDITDRIRISSSTLSNSESGEYPVTVQVTNSSGDTAVLKLIVQIQNTTTVYPVIRLSDYLIYLDRDAELTQDDLRGYITEAAESVTEDALSPADIAIDGEVDTATAGTYYVRYSYTNDRGLTSTVILTVIVE